MISGEGYMAAIPKVEERSPKRGCGVSVTEGRLLTREELAVVLKVSLHTVDRMLAEEETLSPRCGGNWPVGARRRGSSADISSNS